MNDRHGITVEHDVSMVFPCSLRGKFHVFPRCISWGIEKLGLLFRIVSFTDVLMVHRVL